MSVSLAVKMDIKEDHMSEEALVKYVTDKFPNRPQILGYLRESKVVQRCRQAFTTKEGKDILQKIADNAFRDSLIAQLNKEMRAILIPVNSDA